MVRGPLEMNAFAIDTGWTRPETTPTTAMVEETQRIVITNHKRAQNIFNKISANIQVQELPDALDEYWAQEDLMLDALHLFDAAISEELRDIYETHRACLVHGGTQSAANAADPTPAEPGNPNAQQPNIGKAAKKEKTMAFDMDTGNSGSDGPWIAWSARGTQDGAIPAKSFLLRDKVGKSPFDGFTKGVVLDIDKMKTGWQRSEGIAGQAPDWKWNPSISRMEAQPGEDYKKGLSIPCAIGGGNTATWEQAGAAVWNAFTALIPALQQGPGDGSLPLVRMTGAKFEQFARGSTNTPVLEVVKWVPRPDCLKEGFAAGVDTGEAKTPPAAQPAPQPAPAAAETDEDMPF